MFHPSSTKIRKQIYGLLTNKWALGCFAILTVQQILEASATLWLVKMVEAITAGNNFFPYLILYLSFIVVPYIPYCLAFIIKTSWKQGAERSFINAFVTTNRNHIGEWRDKALKEEKLSVLTSEGPNAINNLIDYVFDLYYYTLSVALNILALTIIVEPLFAVAYGISVTAVVLIMKVKKKIQKKLTQQAVSARIRLCQQLLGAWDNVLLGNHYNFNLWQNETKDRLGSCLKLNLHLERFNQILAIAISLISSIPSVIVVIYTTYTHRHNIEYLTSFAVTLPILFQILYYTFFTLSLAFKWSMHKGKLLAIYKAIQLSKETQAPMEEKIIWEKISVTQSTNGEKTGICKAIPLPVTSQEDLLKQITTPGRLTLRGENGTGKSTALLLVKKNLLDKAFFLPTHSELSFDADAHPTSTGEGLKKRLTEISQKVDVDVLLLDEWDANLDKENSQILSNLIDELAAKKCIIEVRHR